MFHRIFFKSKLLQFPRIAAKPSLQKAKNSKNFIEMFDRMEKAGIGELMDKLIQNQVKKGVSQDEAYKNLLKLDFTSIQNDKNIDDDFKETLKSLQKRITMFGELEKDQEKKTGKHSPFLKQFPVIKEIDKLQQEVSKLQINDQDFDLNSLEQKLEEETKKGLDFTNDTQFLQELKELNLQDSAQLADQAIKQQIEEQFFNKQKDQEENTQKLKMQQSELENAFKGQNKPKKPQQKQPQQSDKLYKGAQKENQFKKKENQKQQNASVRQESLPKSFLNEESKRIDNQNYKKSNKSDKSKMNKNKKGQ